MIFPALKVPVIVLPNRDGAGRWMETIVQWVGISCHGIIKVVTTREVPGALVAAVAAVAAAMVMAAALRVPAVAADHHRILIRL